MTHLLLFSAIPKTTIVNFTFADNNRFFFSFTTSVHKVYECTDEHGFLYIKLSLSLFLTSFMLMFHFLYLPLPHKCNLLSI